MMCCRTLTRGQGKLSTGPKTRRGGRKRKKERKETERRTCPPSVAPPFTCRSPACRRSQQREVTDSSFRDPRVRLSCANIFASSHLRHLPNLPSPLLLISSVCFYSAAGISRFTYSTPFARGGGARSKTGPRDQFRRVTVLSVSPFDESDNEKEERQERERRSAAVFGLAAARHGNSGTNVESDAGSFPCALARLKVRAVAETGLTPLQGRFAVH